MIFMTVSVALVMIGFGIMQFQRLKHEKDMFIAKKNYYYTDEFLKLKDSVDLIEKRVNALETGSTLKDAFNLK